MSTESAPANNNSQGHNQGHNNNHGHETQVADSPRAGEDWRDMIERQKEELRPGGWLLERMRSLPDEQRGRSENPQGRGLSEIPTDQPLMVENVPVSYQQMLGEVSQRGAPEQERHRDIDR